MKIRYFFLFILFCASCSTVGKKHKLVASDKIQKEHLNVEKEIKVALPETGLHVFQKEKIAFLNVHDFPDSTLLSAKTKMNPPDLAIDEAKLMQMERSEILRQALETFCDNCQHFEVILPIEKLSEHQFNFFFDKIFLKQEVSVPEITELTTELAGYDKLVLILSSEDYEKNRGFNKSQDVIATTEGFIRAEVYVFDLNKKTSMARVNLKLSNQDHIYYQKTDISDRQDPKILKSVKETNIKTLLNDTRYDDIYPYPVTTESLTLFHFFYNELGKILFMDVE